MARLQILDALEACRRTGHRKEVEDLIDAAQIGPYLDHAAGEQRLDFRAEQQPLAALVALSLPIERADAEAIACEDHATLADVPKCKGELAAQLGEHIRAMLFP